VTPADPRAAAIEQALTNDVLEQALLKCGRLAGWWDKSDLLKMRRVLVSALLALPVAEPTRDAQTTAIANLLVDAAAMDRAADDLLRKLKSDKHGAYNERDRLVAVLSKLWPSHLADHPADDLTWDDEWRTIVCVHSPVGQLTWHIKDGEQPLFVHLSKGDNDWDGHTTEQKYQRLESLALPVAETGWHEEKARLEKHIDFAMLPTLERQGEPIDEAVVECLSRLRWELAEVRNALKEARTEYDYLYRGISAELGIKPAGPYAPAIAPRPTGAA